MRSRAVFKLEEINAKERLLLPGRRVVDLGAAPGGWSQYAARLCGRNGRVFALDLLPMHAIPGVEFLLKATSRETRRSMRCSRSSAAAKVDLVLSDMAPNMIGIARWTRPAACALMELALCSREEVLRPGGALLVKVFQGAGFEQLRGARLGGRSVR